MPFYIPAAGRFILDPSFEMPPYPTTYVADGDMLTTERVLHYMTHRLDMIFYYFLYVLYMYLYLH